MVTINTTDDLIRALLEQPEFLQAARNLILSQELIDTPNRLDRISEQIAELFRAMAQTDRRLEEYIANTDRNVELFNQRFDRLESDMAEVKSDIGGLKTDVSVLKTDMVEVKADIGGLKTDVSVLKTDMVEVKADIGGLKTDVSVLKTDMAEVKADVSVLKTDMVEVKADIGGLKTDVSVLKTDMTDVKAKLDRQTGIILEQRAHRIILNIAKDHLDLTRGSILKSDFIDMGRRLRDGIDDAEEKGLITEDEADNLRLIDLIIRGRRRSDRVHVHVAIEVSQTINNDDITRARDRAKTLAAVTGTEAIAAVIGAIVNPPQQALAHREGVQVVIPVMFSE